MAKSLKTNVDLGPHQYDITPESAHSAVLLLKSEEPEILRNVKEPYCSAAFIVNGYFNSF